MDKRVQRGRGCRCKWSTRAARPEGNKDYEDVGKRLPVLCSSSRASLDLDYSVHARRHVTPGTRGALPLTHPPCSTSDTRSHPHTTTFHAPQNPAFDPRTLQLLSPTHELRLLFLETRRRGRRFFGANGGQESLHS